LFRRLFVGGGVFFHRFEVLAEAVVVRQAEPTLDRRTSGVAPGIVLGHGDEALAVPVVVCVVQRLAPRAKIGIWDLIIHSMASSFARWPVASFVMVNLRQWFDTAREITM